MKKDKLIMISKKVASFVVFFISLFCFCGCSSTNDANLKPASLKEITGDVVKATLNTEGNVVIDENSITTNATYIDYDVDGVSIGLLAVRDSNGNVKVVVNTCQSCGGAPYAYFVQVGNKIQCQNCGSMFDIDDLDNVSLGGCNPILLNSIQEKDGFLVIKSTELKELKSKFNNWEGPKA